MAHEPTSFRQHPMWRAAAYFSFAAGGVILLLWLWRLLSGALTPDFQAAPFETWSRLVAEVATGVALLVAGYGLVTGARWVRKFYLVATGMLIFAGVNGLGHYMHRGQTGIVILYLVIAVVAFAMVQRVEE